MRTKRWQAGLIALVAVAVSIMATPAMGSVFANEIITDWGTSPGWLPGDAAQRVAANDGSALEIPWGETLVLAFPGDGVLNGSGIDLHFYFSILPEDGGAGGAYVWAYDGAKTMLGYMYVYTDIPDVDFEWFQTGSGIPISVPVKYLMITTETAPVRLDAVEAGYPVGPGAMINALITKVASFNLQQGIDNSLDAKLEAALQALEDVNANNDASAVNRLEAFISEVNAQRGNKLTIEQADALVADAQAIILVLVGP
jgi:hypothetical protein